MKEELEITEALVSWVKRLVRLEGQMNEVYLDRQVEHQFVSADQIDELTIKVEQNMMRKLRERFEENQV